MQLQFLGSRKSTVSVSCEAVVVGLGKDVTGVDEVMAPMRRAMCLQLETVLVV